jgi:nondiscriminating glutamyl-tRNA synthetase
MIADFALERASKSGAIFDEEKLHWLNAIYIRNCKTEDLFERLKPFLDQAGYKTAAIEAKWLNEVIELVKTELTTLAGIGSHIDIFFDDKYEITAGAKQILNKEGAFLVLKMFGEYLKTATGNPQENYLAAIKYTKEKTGAKDKDLFMPIRAALTGKVHGPELDKVFAILGKDTALKRLKSFSD